MAISDQRFAAWVDALFDRHLAELTFQEVRRGLRALSDLYVQRRGDLSGQALSSAGKRAAFALYYGPVHFLLVDAIVERIVAGARPLTRLVDLGCGSAAASAAWALRCDPSPAVTGVDRQGWAVAEGRWTLRALGLKGRTRRGEIQRAELPHAGGGIIAAYSVNELAPEHRERLRGRLLAASARGAQVLAVEPIASGPVPWWGEWAEAFAAAGGRADTWEIKAELPERLRLLERAAGLRHDWLKGRSLYLPGGRTE